MNRRITALIVAVVFLWCGYAVAQQTGTLRGTAKDEQGGVLPGANVTISSPDLIGGSQTAVTGPAGGYTFRNLPPGTYTVSFSMSGFGTYTREGIVVSVATTTTVDGSLTVGSIEETITVTGESPVVNVKSTITQTNIDEQMYEAVPTGRNPWVMAGLVPGMVTGQLDVGGNAGMQQYTLEVSGSADSQKSFSIDGLKVNWPGGGGGATMQYYDFAMYDEYNFQTSAGTAESDVAGVYMNMVTKSGGNQLSGTQSAYFMNDAMQSTNVESGGGNEVDVSYDLNASVGGPFIKDKLWWFGAGRWWRLDQFNPGKAFNPDGSRIIDDNLIRNLMAKGTWQIDDSSRFFIMWNKNWKYRYHRNDLTAVSFPTTIATSFQKQPAQNLVLSFNRVIGTAAVLDVRFGRMWGETPYIYQEEVDQSNLRNTHFYDTGTQIAERSSPNEYRNPNERLQFNASMSYYMDNIAGGSHDFKVGIQVGRDTMKENEIMIGDTHLAAIDGVADEAILWNTPYNSDVRVNDFGLFVQDAWTIAQRATLNLGLRFDSIKGRIPSQTSPAGTWGVDQNISEIKDVPSWGPNVAPRIGLSYDLLGDGKTAVKAYYGRFYIQTGSSIPSAMNPAFQSSVNVPWLDNGDLFLEPGPSGTYVDSPELDLTRLYAQGFVGGSQSMIDPDLERPYVDNIDIGIQTEIMPNFSVGVTYHRRQHRRGVGRPDRNRPTDAYDPVQVNYDDPVDGPQTITVYNAQPDILTGGRDLYITNVNEINSDYNGVEIVARKRYSDNWQMLAGITFNSHKGFNYSDSYIQLSDFNNPNFTLNRDDGSVFTELPWTFKLSGSYMFPHNIQLAGKWEARDGIPLTRELSVTGLNQGTEVVYAAQRGTDRAEAVKSFIDVSLSWSAHVGRSRIEPELQIFNILNNATVLSAQGRIGSGWGQSTRYLSPRVLRIGVKWVF